MFSSIASRVQLKASSSHELLRLLEQAQQRRQLDKQQAFSAPNSTGPSLIQAAASTHWNSLLLNNISLAQHTLLGPAGAPANQTPVQTCSSSSNQSDANQTEQLYVQLNTFWYVFLALITTIGLVVSLVSNMIIIYLFTR